MHTEARTFRVFVSSTFCDFQQERNALHDHVFPQLRELAERHGCRFQAIDLRWGVRDEAALDQQAMPICLEEIARCQQLSPRPNFIVLLGDRYGWRPAPWEIPAQEFDAIVEVLSSSDSDLIHSWYERDDNAVPPTWCLRPRAGMYRDADAWSDTERRLIKVFADAAAAAGIPDPTRYRYQASATEFEARRGILSTDPQTGQAFAFFRRIDNLPLDGSIGDFVDLLPDGSPDEPARARIEELKNTLRARLPGRVYDYTTSWRQGAMTLDHLHRLCDDVFDALSTVIHAEVGTVVAVDELDREVSIHKEFEVEHARHFVGREYERQRIHAYLRASEGAPMAVRGDSGSGKSALMAHLAMQIESDAEAKVLVRRYIGATPSSTDVRSLLRTLVHQIRIAYAQSAAELPDDVPGLTRQFELALSQATGERPLVVLLDALDQLSVTDGVPSLTWLPGSLPPHAAIVISSTSSAALEMLERRLPASHMVALDTLTRVQAEDILARWLSAAGRTLQPEQRAAVMDGFAQCGLPLYLRLAFESAKRWTSTSPAVHRKLGCDVGEVVSNFLRSLADEARHGPTLVLHTLAYLCSARHGLSEDEILDLLSRDTEVFEDFVDRAKHRPPSDRLPVSVWSRLYLDLSPYLNQRADPAGNPVLGYFHRRFQEVVREGFLPQHLLDKAHQRLADYFDFDPDGSDGASRPRSLTELPFHAVRSSSWAVVNKLLASPNFVQSKSVVGLGWELADDYRSAIAALDRKQEGDSPEADAAQTVAAFGRAFGQEMAAVLSRPGDAAAQVYNRVFESAGTGSTMERRLADFARIGPRSLSGLWLRRLNHSARTGPSAALRYTLKAHDGAATAVASSGDQIVATGGKDGYSRVWDARHGTLLAQAQLFDEPIAALCFIGPEQDTLAAAGRDGRIQLWNWSSNRRTMLVAPQAYRLRALTSLNTATRLASGSEDGSIRLIDVVTGEITRMFRQRGRILCLLTLDDGRILGSAGDDGAIRLWDSGGKSRSAVCALRGHRGEVRCMSANQDARLLASGGGDGTVRIWDLTRELEIHRIDAHGGRVRCVAMGRGESPVVVAGGDDGVVRLWDAESGEAVDAWLGHIATVTALAVMGDGVTIASAGADGTLRLWDPKAAQHNGSAWEHQKAVGTLWSSEAFVASASVDGRIALWSKDELAHQATLRGHYGPVTTLLGLAPDHLISGGEDRALRIWQIAASPQGRLTARGVAALGNQLPAEWSQRIRSGKPPSQLGLDSLIGHSGPVTSLCAAGSSRVVSGGKDGTLRLWDITQGKHLAAVDVAGSVARLIFDPGCDAAVASTSSPDLFLWPLSEPVARRLEGHRASVTALLAPKTGSLLSSSFDHTVRAWSIPAGESREIVRHDSPVTALAWCAVRGLGASAAYEGHLILWDENGRHVAEVDAHGDPVLALEFDGIGGHLYSCSRDGEVRAWRLPDLALDASIKTGIQAVALRAITPDRVCLGAATGGLSMLQLACCRRSDTINLADLGGYDGFSVQTFWR